MPVSLQAQAYIFTHKQKTHTHTKSSIAFGEHGHGHGIFGAGLHRSAMHLTHFEFDICNWHGHDL